MVKYLEVFKIIVNYYLNCGLFYKIGNTFYLVKGKIKNVDIKKK